MLNIDNSSHKIGLVLQTNIYISIIDTKISSIYNSISPILDGLHAHHIMFLGDV
jgi:hypothetical protein